MKRVPSFPWMVALKGNPLEWLLEEENPPVRYLTLTRILERPDEDSEVVEAKEAVWGYPPVQILLKALEETPVCAEGTPFGNKLANRDLDTLARFGIPGGHPAIAHACEQLLNTELPVRASCYPEQMVGGLIRYADPDDPRLEKKIRFVVNNQPFADGNRPGVLRYGSRGCCCGAHSCYSAVLRALWAIAGIPEERRTREVRDFLERGAAFLAAHRLFKSNHKGFRPIKRDWSRLHLPFGIGWRTDVMDILDVAAQIGLHDDPSAVDALQFVISKQNERGRWALEEGLKNYAWLLMSRVRDVEAVGEESKWITAMALTQLKRCEKRVLRLCDGEEFEPPAEPSEQPMFSAYPFPYDAADRARVRAEWKGLGMQSLLERLLRFADSNGLRAGWHWGFAMGPEACPEWCAAEVRWIPRKGDRKSWPVCRIYFLARRGQFTPEEVSARLKVPVEDEHEKARFNKFFWNALWRIRMEKWKGDYEEIAVTLREPKEFGRLRGVMREALEGLS